MSESEPTTIAEDSRERTGAYVVMREIESVEELTEILRTNEVEVYAVVGQVRSRDDGNAIKAVAVLDDSVVTGRYVAVPMRSWRPRVVKTVVQLSLTGD